MPPDETPRPPAPPYGPSGDQQPQVYGPQTPFQQPQPVQQPGQTVQPQQPQSPQVMAPGQPAPSPSSGPDAAYGFITDPPPPPKRSLLESLPGGGSLISRVGLIAGGLVVLLIIMTILRGLLSSGGAVMDTLITVVQDQQEMIHLASSTDEQQGLSSASRNFTATLEAAVSSSQSQAISYLATNHKKLDKKKLNLKVSSAIDEQLASAATSGTYDQTYQEIMRAQLNTYESDLQKAYQAIKGKNGRALLKDTYNQALLLGLQLKAPAS